MKHSKAQRLVIAKYPSKAEFRAEANRTDCSSCPALHVEVCHDFMSTTQLWDLLAHEWPPWNLPKPTKLKMMADLMRKESGFPSVLRASDISLHEWHKPNPSHPEYIWYSPQIYVWHNDTSRQAYRMWITWCKKILKRKARYGSGAKGEIYNPFEELHLRVRIEFHD